MNTLQLRREKPQFKERHGRVQTDHNRKKAQEILMSIKMAG